MTTSCTSPSRSTNRREYNQRLTLALTEASHTLHREQWFPWTAKKSLTPSILALLSYIQLSPPSKRTLPQSRNKAKQRRAIDAVLALLINTSTKLPIRSLK